MLLHKTRRALRGAVCMLPLLAVLAAIVWTAPAQAQFFGRNKIQYKNFHWQILNTPHFEIFFYPEEEELAARAAVIAEDAYLRLSRIFDHELSSQIPFVLYASPNDFQQTNISDELIGEGTGGFSEPMRNRMVLPYPGDNAQFVHVLNHELVHVFMFDVVYKSTRPNAVRRAWFPIELWWAEGMAEWFSSGWDENADMWMRDATIYDWVVPLPYIYGGYQVYKQGQSAMHHIARVYGEQKVVELFRNMGRTRNVDRALEATIGLNTEKFSEEWIKGLKHEYWPLYGNKMEPDRIGRRLTDHWEEGNYFSQQPSISPDGRYIAYFSDSEGLMDLLLMDAIEGQVIGKLVTGYRSNRFLTLHSFESSIGFSPDSEQICFVAKSGRDEHLFVVRIHDGEVVSEIPLEMDIARSPAWSPQDDRIVLSGTRGGQTDLYVVELKTEEITQITDTVLDEHSPAWYPSSDRIIYSVYPQPTVDIAFEKDDDGILRLQPVDFGRRNVRIARNSYDLVALDLSTGEEEVVIATSGADQDPFVVDERTILFVSDMTGVMNLYSYDIETGALRRLTDVLGGIYHPSASPASDRLVFTAFHRAGFDIFLCENLKDLIRSKDYPQTPEVKIASMPSPQRFARREIVLDLRPDAETNSDTRVALGGVNPVRPDPPEGAGAEISAVERKHDLGVPVARAVAETEPEPGTDLPAKDRGAEETRSALPLEEAGVNAAAGDSNGSTPPSVVEPTMAAAEGDEAVAIGTVEPYRLRFSLDPVGSGYGGIYYTSGTGLGVANVLSLSDLLGNHRMQFLINFYGSIKNSDLAASYYYLKQRVNLAGGIFHYRNLLNSNFTSLGEIYDQNRTFSERNYGVFGLASYPFTTFTRLDFELQAFISEKTFYDFDPFVGLYFETGRQRDRVVQPSLSYVHDSTLYGRWGPVTGTRYAISFSPTLGLSEQDVDRATSFVDYRRYFQMWDRNTFVVRLVGAQSVGRTPRNFVIGGPWTLRGWDVYDFEKIRPDGSPLYPNLLGQKMLLMNLEYRFPALDAIIFGWPGRWGIGGIEGAAYFDVGTAFDDEVQFFGSTPSGAFKLQDLNADFGFGIRVALGFLPLKFDWAWKTDFATTARSPQFNFSIGPQF